MCLSKLTIKQKRFVDEYIISGNATDAAIKAGYSKRTAKSIGAENLTKPDIVNALREREKEIQSKKIAKQEEVLEYLTSILRNEQTQQTLIGVGKGVQAITDIELSAADKIKAAELIGKRFGMWTDKVDLDIKPIIIDGADELED